MMDVITIAGVAVAGVTGAIAATWRARACLAAEHNRANAYRGQRDEVLNYLIALRRNCFLTNAKGNRVRYWNATPEQRAKAEGMGE